MLELPPDWQRDALCVEYPDVEFFPAKGQSNEPARAVCARCLVRVECLDYALSAPETRAHGVWAGTTPLERKRLTRDAA
jgi:WhiB family redox-sensing transcriptional regulator